MTYARLNLGKWGEDRAADHLQGKGWKILERNLRTPVGEIDLVARRGRALAFVEVKTRRTASFGTPQEAVGRQKQRQIIRAAQWYLGQKHDPRLQPRFDVIAVTAAGETPQIEHITDAFGL